MGACDGRTQSVRAYLFFSFTPNTLFFFFSKNSGINPGQPTGKGRKKKTGIIPGQAAEKGRKKKKKNPGINPGQPTEKGRKKKKKNQRRFHDRKCLWPVPPQKTLRGTSTHGHAHGLSEFILV